MSDLLFLLIGIAFFLASWGLVEALNRLRDS